MIDFTDYVHNQCSAEQDKIVGENIKSGINILGVDGTYVGGIKSFTKYAGLPTISDLSSIAYGKGKYVAVTSSSNEYIYSVDGESWTKSTMPSSGWAHIIYAHDMFVAAGSAKVAYSIDGINWTETASLASVVTSGSTLAYGCGKFILLSGSAHGSQSAAYSLDGINWSQYYKALPSCAVGVAWTRVIWSDAHAKFIAFTSNGNYAAWSETGETWTKFSMPSSYNYNICAVQNGDRLLAIPYYYAGVNSVSYSDDGINWSSVELPRTDTFTVLLYGAGRFYLIANSGFSGYTSTDGINWSVCTSMKLGLACCGIYVNNKIIFLCGTRGQSIECDTALTLA